VSRGGEDQVEDGAVSDDYRTRRRIAARGNANPTRLGVGFEQPENVGALLARVRARCGACGKKATGSLARYEVGEFWEQAGDRFTVFFVAEFICRDHGLLPFAVAGRNGDRLDRAVVDAALARAAARPDRCLYVKLRPSASGDTER
jgi:hypothetical protein